MNEQEPKKGGKLLKISKIVFLALVAVFLVRYFYRNFDDIKNLNLVPQWPLFALSVALVCIYKLTEASLWHYITILNEASIPYGEGVRAYLYSILGKYIPGKVFMLLARIPPYQKRGVPASKVTVCFLLENVCTILGAGLLFIVSLFVFPNEEFAQYKWVTILLILAFVICLNPRILNFGLGILEKLTKKSGLRIPVTYPQMLWIVFLFLLNWVVYGTGFYCLVRSFFPVPASSWLYVSGLYGLSCIAGILAIFSPSGIGVREGILLLGLGLIMEQNYAVMISIIARLWAVVTELALTGIVFIADKAETLASKHHGGGGDVI